MPNKIVSYGRGLPIVIYDPISVSPSDVYSYLYHGYIKYYGEKPSQELLLSWRSTLPVILRVSNGYPIIVEYPILEGLERVDYIIVSMKKVLVVEAKSWSGTYRRKSSYIVYSVDSGETRIDPCYQLENYICKFKYLHTAGSKLDFIGIVYAHRFNYIDGCNITSTERELAEIISSLGEPGSYNEVNLIVNGRFQISKSLIEFIRNNKGKLLRNTIKTLVGGGYGLTEDQLKIVDNVLKALDEGEDRAFIIKGVSGSGKTIVALTLFFEALSRGYRVILAYKNNRLLNTLRKALGDEKVHGGKIGGLIKFFSVGPPYYKGVAERNFPVERYGLLDLIIYDEAQRMRLDNIKLSMSRSRVKVYLYDDEQILIGDEEGFTENFIDIARSLGVNYTVYKLSRPVRIPNSYLEAVRNLLTTGALKPEFSGLDFRIYDDIVDMISDLREKYEKGYRVALVAAFTETPGNKKNPRAPDNLRVGYPLCRRYDKRKRKCVEKSDLDIYRGTGLEIYWLMDEKREYPRYWMGELDPLKYCASVYGAQGFEAEYVGVIWGRDLIWRNSKWEVNPAVITDYVGGRDFSLKGIARKDKDKAYRLLINRYLILLTRGTKGVYVFFEDEVTREHIKSFV